MCSLASNFDGYVFNSFAQAGTSVQLESLFMTFPLQPTLQKKTQTESGRLWDVYFKKEFVPDFLSDL